MLSRIPHLGDYTIKPHDESGIYLAVSSLRSPEPFRSKQIVVIAEADGVRAKIISIFWERRLGYYVSLGYLRSSRAVLGRYGNDSPVGKPATFDLSVGGTTTEKRLKFTHHASGQAHFSLNDRKVTLETYTPPLAKTQSAAPGKSMGYVFSVMFRGLDSFDPAGALRAGDTPPLPKNRAELTFQYDGDASAARKLLGWWFPIKAFNITEYGPGLPWEPKQIHFSPDGKTYHSGFLIAPPGDWPWSDYGLAITDDTANAPAGALKTYLVMHGGFNSEHDENGNDVGDSFIAAILSSEPSDQAPEMGKFDAD